MIEVFPAASAEYTDILNAALCDGEAIEAEQHNHDESNETMHHASSTRTPEDSLTVDSRDIVMDTCKQLLLKLDEIRTSVLHLQYSLHAGDLGGVAVDNRERAQKLWSWDQGGTFSAEVSTGVIHGRLNNIFDAGFPDSSDEIVETEPEKSVTEHLYGTIPPVLDIVGIDSDTASIFAVDSPNVGPCATDLTATDGIDTGDATGPVSVEPLSPSDVTSSCV